MILDWPADVIGYDSLFFAGGQGLEGGFTGGSAAVYSPEPGGRAVLRLSFNAMPSEDASRRASWLMSRARNGQAFRVPILRCPQIVTAEQLGIDIGEDEELDGLTWSNGQPWSGGQNWAFEPGALVAAAAQDGETAVRLTMAGTALQYGHLIGFARAGYATAHHIDAIDHAGGVATLVVSPPLRFDLAAGDFASFRPKITGMVRSPDNLQATFDPARNIRPGGVDIVEVLR